MLHLGNRPFNCDCPMDLTALTAEVLERCEVLARFSEEPGRLTRTFLRTPVRDVQDGVTLAQAVRDFGLDPAKIAQAAYRPGQVTGYVEAHIEQGPLLESIDHPVGVVKAIVGQSRSLVRFTGRAGHAGTLPMGHRRD